MSDIDTATIVEIAEKVQEYILPIERADALVVEVQSYLETIARNSRYLTFDDAPSDFDAELARLRR